MDSKCGTADSQNDRALRLTVQSEARLDCHTQTAMFRPPAFCSAIRSASLVTLMIARLSSPVSAADADIALGITKTFEKHCIQCHGHEDIAEGDVNLADLTANRLGSRVELVRKLIHVLDTREMPPEDETQPSPELREELIRDLREILHTTVAEQHTAPRTPIRRMNRFQYNNAVVDLFRMKCIVFTLPERVMRDHGGYFQPASGKMARTVTVGNRPLGKSQMIEPRLNGVAAFPQDLRAEHGYDTQADHLSLSPLLMEAFLTLGQSITNSPDFVPRQVGIWKTFFALPTAKVDVESEVRRRLRLFLAKAFRHPADDVLVDRYTGFVTRQLENGSDFTTAMKSVAAAAIASPRFLYLYDKSQQTTEPIRQTIDDFGLATRLAQFLWGSIPDETLLTLAAEGVLHQPETLNGQIDRMLQDRKLKRFCDSFPTQWLQLDRIISSVPNQERFPDFYYSKYRASMHMMLEPLLLFETVLIENLPITQLIDSDFTYRSAKLEASYGELGNDPPKNRGGGVTVLKFRRVPVSDRRSGGVITNTAVMTMTSGPERTQPITRGAWIAGVIFNDPPDPPPADVPPLPEQSRHDTESLTLRERLAQHRERADCRGCHEQIDPLGFALENYNAVGVWRNNYENGRDIDASGALFRRHYFSDVVQFKEAILAEKHRFCRALAGHLLAFALAREVGAADQPALDQIAEATAADNYRLQTLIRQVILSEPFRTKS